MSLVEPLQQADQFALRADVKGAGWLVRDQQGRAVKHGHGDQHKRPEAARHQGRKLGVKSSDNPISATRQLRPTHTWCFYARASAWLRLPGDHLFGGGLSM
jgi:hypothetical protein